MRDEAKRNRVSALRKAEKGRMPACEMKRSGIERAHCVRQEGVDARVRTAGAAESSGESVYYNMQKKLKVNK